MRPSRALFLRLGLVAIGLLAAVILLEVGMRAAGLVFESSRHHRNNQRLASGVGTTVLCLGESTTLGDPLNLRYPDALEEILNTQLGGSQVRVINGGRYGVVTDQILADLDANLDRFDPEIVVTMMGINDFGKTHAYGTIIAPGADRWYGSIRVYKLYRVLRVAIERRILGGGESERFVIADGISQVERSNDLAGSSDPRRSSFQSRVDEATAAVFEAAMQLRMSGRFDEAEEMLVDVVRREPLMVGAHIQLAGFYTSMERHREAHDVLVRCAASLPGPSIDIQEALATSSANLGMWDEAIATMIELRQDFVAADDYLLQIHFARDLAEINEAAGRLDQAEHYLTEIADRLSPGDDVFCQDLIDFLVRQGRVAEADERRRQQQRIRHDYVNPLTHRRYREMVDALASRGITHLAVQYPVRRIETLRRLLDHDDRPVYVDNSFFADLVARDGAETYFTDRFGGDFGHMTSVAHELLAENIARSIIEDHFGKDFDENWRGPEGGPAVLFKPLLP